LDWIATPLPRLIPQSFPILWRLTFIFDNLATNYLDAILK